MPRTVACPACYHPVIAPDGPVARVLVCPCCQRQVEGTDPPGQGPQRRQPGVIPCVLCLAGIGVLIAVFLASCLANPSIPPRGVKRDMASLQVQHIQRAIWAYHDKTGKYPESLEQLVMRTEGMPPWLEGGEYAVTDPWDKPFNFEIIPATDGTDRIVVWTTDPKGERIQWPEREPTR